MKAPYFIVDFDSTFTRVEALDVLAEIVLAHSSRREEVLQEIQDITNRGMDGELDFRTSLTLRLGLLRAHRDDIQHLAERLSQEISPSFGRNQPYFVALRDNVYVVSNGFRDFIVPVVTKYGLRPDNVLANDFIYDERGYVIGFDTDNPLSSSGGKSKVIRDLKLTGDVYVIGDGANDLEIRKAGYANKFYLFTENIEREKVKPEADHIAPSVDEILYELKMSRSLSYPKNRLRVLLLHDVPATAVTAFEQEGYRVERATEPLSEAAMSKALGTANVLCVGSQTRITDALLASTRRLISIGVFDIPTHQHDLAACARRGIAVFNAPFSHARSVAELALAEMILLLRQLPAALEAARSGSDLPALPIGREIQGRKLGIVGYGNIGSQLSVLAEALGMQVYFYDIADKFPLGKAQRCSSMEELLRKVEVVSLHIDARPENENFFGAAQFALLPPGAILLNLAYPPAVDTAALRAALQSGRLGGCALDHLPAEADVATLPNVLLTPQLGGYTVEARDNITDFVPSKVIQYVNTGATVGSVNFPQLQVPPLQNAHRLLHIHHNVPGVVASIDRVLSEYSINIVGQYLKTRDDIGYVITDVDQEYSEELLEALKHIGDTIWFRVLY